MTGVKGRRVISLTYPLSRSEYVEKTHFVGFRPAKLLISKDVARHDSTTTIKIKNTKKHEETQGNTQKHEETRGNTRKHEIGRASCRERV